MTDPIAQAKFDRLIFREAEAYVQQYGYSGKPLTATTLANFGHRLLAAIGLTPDTPTVMACTGCGTILTMEQLRAIHPDAVSCCPERKMRPHFLVDAHSALEDTDSTPATNPVEIEREAKALLDAYEAGARDMRERAALKIDQHKKYYEARDKTGKLDACEDLSRAVRALPLLSVTKGKDA
jgi:hypothetical protein